MIEINKSWKLKIKIFKKNNYDIQHDNTTNDFINIKTNFQIIYFISIL